MTNDDFYIGYETPIPPKARQLIRRSVIGALAAGAVLACLLVTSQDPFATSSFAFGRPQRYRGVIVARPYPTLVTATERLLLVAPGKRGADADVAPFDGRLVSVMGTPIVRADRTMVELDPGSLAHADGEGAPTGSATEVDLGEATLAGEIVDGKCYLGVMNPGEGTVHRDCARACVRGGVPPMFAARAPDGQSRLLLMIAPDGSPIGAAAAPLVGIPISVRGRVILTQPSNEWRLVAALDAYVR